jgi:hypothetical protein
MSSRKERQSSGAVSRSLPPRIRWLAAWAGCTKAVALLGVSSIFSLLAIPLVLSAVLASWFPRAGTWLILIPALILSVMVLPICIANAVELVTSFSVAPRAFTIVAIQVSWLLSPILLISCIATVWRYSLKHRRESL